MTFFIEPYIIILRFLPVYFLSYIIIFILLCTQGVRGLYTVSQGSGFQPGVILSPPPRVFDIILKHYW